MPKPNTRSSWIDPRRLGDLIEKVRPGSTQREKAAATWDAAIGDKASGRVVSLPDDYVLDPIPGGANRQKFSLPEDEVEEEPSEVATEVENSEHEVTLGKQRPMFIPFVMSTSSRLDVRLSELLVWVKEQTAASLVFVVDAYGAALAMDPTDCDPAFLASASNLADALGRGRGYFSSPDLGAMHLELGSRKEFLCLVHGKWDASTVAVGMLRKDPLPWDLAVEFRKALETVGEEPANRRARD